MTYPIVPTNSIREGREIDNRVEQLFLSKKGTEHRRSVTLISAFHPHQNLCQAGP